MRRRSLFASLATVVALSLVLSSVALGASGHRTVKMLDKCDPVTFNAALGEGACVKHRGGRTTFDEAFAQFVATGQIDGWEFKKDKVELKEGGRISAPNRGGEFHTFTEVAAFGGGCVPELNAGQEPVPECAGAPDIFFTTGAAPGQTVKTGPLDSGIHKFMCLIHPWMRTVASAERNKHHGD